MREVKFRAYIKEYELIVDVQTIDFRLATIGCYLTISHDPGDLSTFHFSEIDLMEFIGKKDKSDVDIYEGYVVEYLGEYRYIIDYSECGFLNPVNDLSWDNCPIDDRIYERCGDFEVIGNIYENPEMRK